MRMLGANGHDTTAPSGEFDGPAYAAWLTTEGDGTVSVLVAEDGGQTEAPASGIARFRVDVHSPSLARQILAAYGWRVIGGWTRRGSVWRAPVTPDSGTRP